MNSNTITSTSTFLVTAKLNATRISCFVIATIILISAGCNQNRYEPAKWRKRPGANANGTTLPGATLPGTTLPGTTLPGTTLPGTTLPGTTLPSLGGEAWRATTLPY